MAVKLNLRLEIVDNGVTITNRLTGNKAAFQNSSSLFGSVKQFIADSIEAGEPGMYYDIDTTITTQRNKKPTGA